MKAKIPYVWPMRLDQYDRSASVSRNELTLLRALLAQGWRGQHRKPEWIVPLARILEPLQTAMDAIQEPCNGASAAVHVILAETVKHKRTVWHWSHQHWIQILGHRAVEAKTPGRGFETRTGLLAMGAMLQCLGDVRDFGQFDRPALAHRIFGKTAVAEADIQILNQLAAWGFGKSKQPIVMFCLHELLLLNQSPRLEDLTFDLLAGLYENPRPKIRKQGLYRISLCLHQIGVLEKPLPHSFTVARIGKADNLLEGIDPRWVAFVDRWVATTTLEEGARLDTYYLALKAGRWVTKTFPEQASPELWTRQTAAQYVAAVCRLTVGEWACQIRHKELQGKPLKAAAIASYLSALRTLFRDGAEWEWIPRRFDPRICLRNPPSIRNKLGPNPRAIADDVWAKLVWAGVNLTEKDICPVKGKHHMYPLALLRATAMIWLFAGLRADEIFRLRIGAISWGPRNEDLTAARVCYLNVPINKTNIAFVKPIDSIVGEAIEEWEKIRPAQPSQLDKKTGEMVDFLLSTRTRRLSQRYLNRIMIPALCRKAGVPRSDARGLITSHRARTTIASQLYNAKEPLTLFELQAWLGHRNPVSTQFYANITPTKLARSFDDAGYFERNLRAIDVLIDQSAIRRGVADNEPWKYYDLGHGYCTYDFFDQCAHRMACAKCSFYLPKDSSAASLLEGKQNLLRLRQRIPLLDSEIAAVDDGVQAFDALLKALEAVATPSGPTPADIKEDLVQITRTAPKGGGA